MIRKILKVIGIVIAISIMVIAISAMYYSRDRTIDLTGFIPEELEVCGRKITVEDIEYTRLHNWLKLNKEPWQNAPASYMPNYVYRGEGFHINVSPTGVIANVDMGGWSQVSIQAPTNTILGTCN